ncbi:hypothetical protein BH24CHL6_BH24CHL6_02490 [soil metagenome]
MEQDPKRTHPDELDPDQIYGQFPDGSDFRFGLDEGYARLVRINDISLFSEEALNRSDIGPAIRTFCGEGARDSEEPPKVYYIQLKSSTAESEFFVHKPTQYFAGEIEGIAPPSKEPVRLARLQTLVMNHERTLARMITRSILVVDEDAGAQVVHKQGVAS